MAKQLINLGVAINDGTGDTLRVGAQKINDNFNELYNSLGYSLPIATPGRLGGVKIGSNINESADGTISVTFPSIPTASTTALGGVKVDGSSIIIDNGVISAISSAFSLPVATTQSLGGVKIDGSTITINNGVISAVVPPSYSLPTATDSVLGGIKVGSRLSIADGVLSADVQSYVLPTASGSTLGGVKIDGTSIVIADGVISTPLLSRTTVSETSITLNAGESGTFNIVGYKSYAILKMYVSAAAWVTLYTDNASRTADASRLETEDPLPGSGVIAEVITTAEDTILMSPGTIGFNNENVPTTNIPVKVVNKGITSTSITVTLTLVKLEG